MICCCIVFVFNKQAEESFSEQSISGIKQSLATFFSRSKCTGKGESASFACSILEITEIHLPLLAYVAMDNMGKEGPNFMLLPIDEDITGTNVSKRE